MQQQLQDVLQGGAAPPLLVHLLAKAARLQQELNSLQHEWQGMPSFVVSACVRYGSPSIAAVLQQLQQQQPPLKMLLLPLYPQPTASCTASAYDSIFSEIMKWRSAALLLLIFLLMLTRLALCLMMLVLVGWFTGRALPDAAAATAHSAGTASRSPHSRACSWFSLMLWLSFVQSHAGFAVSQWVLGE